MSTTIEGDLPRPITNILTWYWDSGTGKWVKGTQPQGGTGGTASTFGAAFPATGTAAGFKDSTGALMSPGNLDASGNLKVNVAAGSGSNPAASATGAAVPASADYQGVNVGGTLRGQTAVNPSGSVYASQVDLASIAGKTVETLDYDTGAGTDAMPILGLALPGSGGAVAGGTSSNPVRTDPTGTTTQPVTGTGSAGTAATGVVTVQGIASMTKLLVTPDSVALPANQSVNVSQLAGTTTDTNSGTKSAGTLRVVLATDQPALTNKLLVTPDLPAGASTAAKQPALGTAGTASTDVITIQGIASMTKLLVTPDSVALPANQSVNVNQLAGTTTDTNSGNKSAGTLRVVLATDQPALTNKLLVTPDLPSGASTSAKQDTGNTSLGNIDTNAGAIADAASATGSLSAKLRFIAQTGIPITGTVTVGSHAVTNAGTFAVQESGTQVLTDDAAFTPATTKVVMAGFEADESSTDSVDEGDGGAARMTLDRKQIVTIQPHTAGGWSTFMATSGDGSTALTNSAQAVKASAGKLGGWYIYNPNATAAYVIIYNVASGSVTVGTTNPQMVLCIPATSAANVEFANGITFSTAISVAATTTGGGNTAPTTALEANFFYF